MHSKEFAENMIPSVTIDNFEMETLLYILLLKLSQLWWDVFSIL